MRSALLHFSPDLEFQRPLATIGMKTAQ